MITERYGRLESSKPNPVVKQHPLVLATKLYEQWMKDVEWSASDMIDLPNTIGPQLYQEATALITPYAQSFNDYNLDVADLPQHGYTGYHEIFISALFSTTNIDSITLQGTGTWDHYGLEGRTVWYNESVRRGRIGAESKRVTMVNSGSIESLGDRGAESTYVNTNKVGFIGNMSVDSVLINVNPLQHDDLSSPYLFPHIYGTRSIGVNYGNANELGSASQHSVFINHNLMGSIPHRMQNSIIISYSPLFYESSSSPLNQYTEGVDVLGLRKYTDRDRRGSIFIDASGLYEAYRVLLGNNNTETSQFRDTIKEIMKLSDETKQFRYQNTPDVARMLDFDWRALRDEIQTLATPIQETIQ